MKKEGWLKITEIIKFVTIMLMILTLNISCASTGFLMAKPNVTMYTRAYPPKAMGAPIDVYQIAMPDREYIEIAKISCGDTDDNWNMKQILKKARDIGADGIIIVGRTGSVAVAVPVGKMAYAVDQGYGITAIAIVYK